MLRWVQSKYIEAKLQTICFYLILKDKEVSNSVSAPFCAWFVKKNISFVKLY